MLTFKDKLFVEYPIPVGITNWLPKPGKPAVIDIDQLIETAVEEIASDILITEHVEASGMITQLPESTVSCGSAMLSGIYPFQGNRLVKVTYDAASHRAYLRYYPAVITYQRKLSVPDLEVLDGDKLIYIKAYILWKMAERELAILKPVNMNVDNGQIDLSVLETFRDDKKKYYFDLKNEILIYNTVN